MEQTQERTYMIMEILHEYFPIECEMAGTSNVFNVANGISKEVRSGGGSNFDISQPLSVLVASVSFINCAITICNTLKRENKPLPTAPELKISIVTQVTIDNEIINKIANDIKMNICQSVIDQHAANFLSNDPASE